MIPVINVEFDAFFVPNNIKIALSKSEIQIVYSHSIKNRNVYLPIAIGFKKK